MAPSTSPELRHLQPVFNPISRLLSITLHVRAASVDPGAIRGAFAGAALANGWVLCVALADGWTWVSADAVLPAAVAPEALTIALESDGAPVLTLPVPESLPEERAGLIAVDRNAGAVRVHAWAAAEAAIVVDGVPMATETVAADAAAYLTAIVPVARPSAIAVVPGSGAGQRLDTPAAWLADHPLTSERLAGLRDSLVGETAWLIGNGPSVRPADLDRLAGRTTFAFNRFHLAHPLTRLRPTFTVSGDRQMIDDHGSEIVAQSGGTVFLARRERPTLAGDHEWLRQADTSPTLFSLDPSCAVTPGGSSLFVAMQVAWWMGVRRFVLYGCDFRFAFARDAAATDPFRSVTGEGNHFIPDYRAGRGWCPPSFRNIAQGFLAARVLAEAHGGWIRNATHGGLLEIFPRIAFDDALAPHDHRITLPLDDPAATPLAGRPARPGWAAGERWGQRSEGPHATLTVRVPAERLATLPETVRLHISAAAAPGAREEQVVTLAVGILSTRLRLPRDGSFRDHALVLPRSAFVDDALTITFTGGDPGLPGIAVSQLWLDTRP